MAITTNTHLVGNRYVIMLNEPVTSFSSRRKYVIMLSEPVTSLSPQGRNVTITCTLRSSKQNRLDSVLIWSKSAGREPFRPLTSRDHEQVVTYCWGSSILVIREPEVNIREPEVSIREPEVNIQEPEVSNKHTYDNQR